MAREQKKYDDDDGRVIASMEGLSQPGLFRRGPVEPGKERPSLRERFAIRLHPKVEQLTPSEARRYTWAPRAGRVDHRRCVCHHLGGVGIDIDDDLVGVQRSEVRRQKKQPRQYLAGLKCFCVQVHEAAGYLDSIMPYGEWRFLI
jgi:hypothetical protein